VTPNYTDNKISINATANSRRGKFENDVCGLISRLVAGGTWQSPSVGVACSTIYPAATVNLFHSVVIQLLLLCVRFSLLARVVGRQSQLLDWPVQ